MKDLLTLGAGDWVATLPSVGTVTVDVNGGVTVSTDPGVDAGAAQMLAQNWGEPLSCLRRGRTLLFTTTLVDPQTGLALAVMGRNRHEQEIMLLMAQQGWRVVADSLTPITVVGGDVIAEPRTASVVVSRDLVQKYPVPVVSRQRPGGTGVTIDIGRADAPARLVMAVQLSERHPAGITPVLGLDKIVWAQGVILRICHTVHEPTAVFAATTAMARLSICTFGIDRVGDDTVPEAMERLTDLWATNRGASE